MKSALITGITGQDGFYLTELLLSKNYQVIGVVRNLQKLSIKPPDSWSGRVDLVEWDMLDQQAMVDILSNFKPIEFYNLAAYSTGAGMYDNPVELTEINGLAVTKILEAIRIANLNTRFCQASSREIFGEAFESPQYENTLVNPRSPYGAAKLYADLMIKIYRQRYGLFACSAVFFNHESPFRSLSFVTRKITNSAVRIKFNLESELLLGNLDARRDWGFAGDFVYAMWLMLQHDYADDYVVATGVTKTVRDFCQTAFDYLGLNYKDYVREDLSVYRPLELIELVGDTTKIKTVLGWSPKIQFNELVHMMVEADIQLVLEDLDCSLR